MANIITLNTKDTTGAYDGRYLKLECEQTSKSSANNTSTIKWTLSAVGGNEDYYSTGPTKVIINGTTVYSKSRVAWSDKTFPASKGSKSGTLTVTHKSDGTKQIKVELSAAVYTSTVSTVGRTWTLDEIDRYATVTQSLKSKTETSITMNWSSDSTIDTIKYSTDNGATWTEKNVTDGKSGSYTISGLKANTNYKVKTQVHRKDNGLTTNSSALSVTTYDYPYCTDSPNFILGNALTLKFYNPLSRAFKFYIIGNGTEIDVEYNCSATSYTGVNNTASSVPYLYATIPNAKSGKYKVKVVYGTSTKTRDNGNTYSIKESECYPTFSANYTIKDVGSKTASITNGAFLIKGYSSVDVEIPASAQMKAKNSATPKNYTASFNGVNKTITYSSTDTTKCSFGVVNATGSKEVSVRAYDSRTLSTLAKKSIPVYDYYVPKVYIDVKRINNFGENATLKVTGNYCSLVVNGVAKNTIKSCKYRYKEKDGETWSDWLTLTTTLNSEKGTFTCNTVNLEKLNNDIPYEFEVQATDSLDNINPTASETLNAGQGIFFISSNKKKCYVNGVEVVSVDNVQQIKYYTQLAEGTDLNTITELGTYRSIQESHTDTMKNVPAGLNGGFTLYVVPWTATPTNTEYRRQELIYGRMTYTRHTTNGGTTWSAWNTTAYLEDLYPVGSVYCSSTNTNPASKLGGTWELIDKGFKSYAGNDTSIFTPATNVVVDGAYLSRSGGTIRIRLTLTINASMSDTGMLLGTFSWNKVGFTGLPMGYATQMAYSDKANGGIVFNITYAGEVNQLDVFDVSTVESGNSFALDVTFTVTQNGIYDSFCDKFYWQRTA